MSCSLNRGAPGRSLSRSRSPAEKRLLSHFQNTDYGTEYESEPESSDIEEEGSLQELQKSLSELVNRKTKCMGMTGRAGKQKSTPPPCNISKISLEEESFICDMPEQSLMSSTQNSDNCDIQTNSVDSGEMDSEYISELDCTRIEDESTLDMLQDSIDGIANSIEEGLENSTLNKSFVCSGNEVTLYKPSAGDVNSCDALPEMDALSSTRNPGSNANRSYNWRAFTPMDSIREEEAEVDAMEDVNDLERTAIHEYIQSKKKKKYLFDGENLIRIKPKRNMEMTAVIGKAFWLRRRIRERMMKQIQ